MIPWKPPFSTLLKANFVPAFFKLVFENFHYKSLWHGPGALMVGDSHAGRISILRAGRLAIHPAGESAGISTGDFRRRSDRDMSIIGAQLQ
jgi:hypothetical protein